MSSFPRLRTGAITQYPSARRSTYATNLTKFVDGSEQRFRDLKQPVQTWVIRLHHLSDEEMQAVESFFDAMHGRFGSFSFVDPWDGTEYADCSFNQDTFSVGSAGEGRNNAYLIIRNNTP